MLLRLPFPARDAKSVRWRGPFLPHQLQDLVGRRAQRRQGLWRRLRQGNLRKGNRARSGRGGQEKVTHPSKSKMRSIAAIDFGCVIPTKVGIQCLCAVAAKRRTSLGSRFRGNDEKGVAVTHPSKSKMRSIAAIGFGCVIPTKVGIQCLCAVAAKGRTSLGSRFRGNDEKGWLLRIRPRARCEASRQLVSDASSPRK